MKNLLRIILKHFFSFLETIVYRPKIVGIENIPKKDAVLICPNHVHALDSAIIVAKFKRKVNVLAKEELFKNGFICWIADVFGIYPVKPDKKSMETVKTSLKILKNNELLMLFPEAARQGMAKGIKPKDGAIKLAIRSGVPIVPVGIQGNFKPFTKVKINIGKPIDYNKYSKEDTNNKELMEKLTQELLAEDVRLRDEKI